MREPASVAQPKPRQLGFLLFVLALVVYLFSGPTFFGFDGEIMYRVAESLVLRHSFQIADPIYHFAQPYSPYGIGTSLLMLPLVALGWLLLHDPRALVLVYLPAVTALTVVVLNRLLVELGASWTRALWLSLAFAFGTLAWHYAAVLFSEPLVALMLTSSVLWLLFFVRTGRRRWLAASGTALSVCLLARFDSAFLVVAPVSLYALYQVLRRGTRWWCWAGDLAVYGAPILGAGLISLLYDVVRYGRPLAGPYSTDPFGFATPLLTGLYGLLLSPGAGLLIYTPVLVIGIVSFPKFFQLHRAEAILILTLLVLRLAFFGRWWDWHGGATWGPRHLVPLVPLLLVPIVLMPGRVRLLTAGLAAIGLGIELLGQLVPFGLYYGLVVPHVAAGLGICHCVPVPSESSRAVSNVIDFQWPYSPLAVQLNLLVRGVWSPAWRPIAFLLPLVLGAVGILVVQSRRLALAVDRYRPALLRQ